MKNVLENLMILYKKKTKPIHENILSGEKVYLP